MHPRIGRLHQPRKLAQQEPRPRHLPIGQQNRPEKHTFSSQVEVQPNVLRRMRKPAETVPVGAWSNFIPPLLQEGRPLPSNSHHRARLPLQILGEFILHDGVGNF